MESRRPNSRSVIDLRTVVKTLGVLIIALSGTMILPLLWSLWFGVQDWLVFLGCILALAVPGYLLSTIKAGGQMRLREAMLTVTAGWVVCAVAGAVPFLLTGSLPNWIDGIFETMSGLTTTGATVVEHIEGLSPGILYWRSLLHWLGGLGIIVIFLAVLPQVGLGATQLYQAEVPGPQMQRLRPRLRETAKVLLLIYIALSVAQTLALTIAGMSFFEAQIHTFGTMATGGFSSRTASIAAFDSVVIEAIIVFFMLAAGTNFALYYRAFFLGDRGAFRRDREFRWYLGFAVIATLILTASIAGRVGLISGFRQSVFQSISIMTTTGFVTADYEVWPEISRLVLLMLMFVGACAGSTGGAMKVTRLVIVAKHLYREIVRTIHPTAVLPVLQGDEVVPERTVRQITGFVGLYLACFALGSMYMAYLGLDLTSAISSVAATIGNIGPGLGAVGPVANYALIPPSGKIVLSVMMLLGRLELFTVIAVLTPAFWRR